MVTATCNIPTNNDCQHGVKPRPLHRTNKTNDEKENNHVDRGNRIVAIHTLGTAGQSRSRRTARITRKLSRQEYHGGGLLQPHMPARQQQDVRAWRRQTAACRDRSARQVGEAGGKTQRQRRGRTQGAAYRRGLSQQLGKTSQRQEGVVRQPREPVRRRPQGPWRGIDCREDHSSLPQEDRGTQGCRRERLRIDILLRSQQL